MAVWKPDNLIVKGAEGAFHDALDNIPTIFQNHCAMYDSTAAVEQYVWPGHVPIPRQFINGRSIQGMRDFTYNVTNNEYELSISINRTHFEDDQVGLIAARMREIAEVWATYKDYLFAQLLINGSTATYVAYDGTIFYADTRVEGASANIDNILTAAAAGTTIPVSSEIITQMSVTKATMQRYQDDMGRPFNTLASTDVRVVIPPTYEHGFAEAVNATFIVGDSTYGSRENVFRGTIGYDVSPYLTADTVMYVNMVGAERKPFIYQERTPLEVEILDDPTNVALHNALLVLCRQRFVFAYGEPRRSVEFTWS